MATIRSDANGDILQILANPSEEQQNPGPVANQAYELRFDEQTNAALLSDLNANINDYKLLGISLSKSNAPVAPAIPQQAWTDINESLPSILVKMAAGDNLTTGELSAAQRIAFRDSGRLLG